MAYLALSVAINYGLKYNIDLMDPFISEGNIISLKYTSKDTSLFHKC